MIVAVQVGPDGRVGIQIFAPANITQHCTLAGRDDNRLVLEPVAHLRERMPDKLAVELGELIHGFKIFSAAVSSATSTAECAAVRVTRKRA